jgi:urease accessory protein
MKLSLNTDFTKFPRAVSVAPAGSTGSIAGRAVLAHDERHLRRRAIELVDGSKILVDLPEPVTLNDGDRLMLEDGRQIEIGAAPEELYDIRARDPVHLAELAWHIGNRHLAAAIAAERILILRDHVIKAMLEGLGATVTDVVEPFTPVRGAYSGHGHGHDHDHHHGHDHDHHHEDGKRDAYGRLPDDPHYGHNHG